MKQFILLAMMLLPMVAGAEDAMEIDGKYSVTSISNNAEIKPNPAEIVVHALERDDLTDNDGTVREDEGGTDNFYVKEGANATPHIFGTGVPGPSVKGDVNGDGSVDVADIASVIDVMAGSAEYVAADVNGDSSVDVADISAIIDIMAGGGVAQTFKYWYAGTTQPTANNYKTLATEVSTYPDRYDCYNNTDKKSHIYVLVAEDVSVEFQNKSLPAPISKIEHTDINIPGHKVVETAVGTAAGGSLYIDLGDAWKLFYIGTTLPTADNYETLTPAYSSLSDMNGATVHVPSSGKIYLLVPYSDSPSQSQLKGTFKDNEGNSVTYITRDCDMFSILRHYIWELTFEPGTTLTFKMTD